MATPSSTCIERVAAGDNHVLALTQAGAVLSFGHGEHGRLGHGDLESRHEPKAIEALRGTRVAAIAAGNHHNMLLTDEGDVLSIGWGFRGPLGHGDEVNQYVPKAIEALRDRRVVAIAACGFHSMVLADEGTVLSFGRGDLGQLGHGDEVNQYVPKAIEALRGTRVVAISAGLRHSMVLTDEGAVLSFGEGIYRQLGHGDKKDQRVPKVIEALHGTRVVAISAGGSHSMVLTLSLIHI